MEFFVDSTTSTETLEEIRRAIRQLIATCGMCEVRYEESPVLSIEKSIVLHGAFELLEVILSPLIDDKNLILAEDSQGEFSLSRSSAVIYPLYEEKGRDHPM